MADRTEDIRALKDAAARMRHVALTARIDLQESAAVFWEAAAALMDKTVWMGQLDADMLSRVPCDQVIALAKAHLEMTE